MQSPSLSQQQQADVLDEEAQPNSSILDWWVRITSPGPDNPRRAQHPWREEVTSLLFPLVLLNVLLPMLVNLNNRPQVAILSIVFIIDVFALFIKRAGYMTLSGIIIIITMEFGLCASILGQGSHFDSVNLPLYDDMIQASLISMAFFAPFVIFGIVLLNCGFLVSTLLLLPHAPDLSQHLKTDFLNVITTPLIMQILAVSLAYIIINALIKAVRRADKAEELSVLKSQIVEQQSKDIELKNQLDDGIKQLLFTLNEAANGNFAVRAPLEQNNALWRVGRSINNLLARLQGLKGELAELEKTRQVAAHLTQMVKSGKELSLNDWTGTCFDPFVMELMNRQRVQSQHPAPRQAYPSPSPTKPTSFENPHIPS
jgi:hypothetical protein